MKTNVILVCVILLISKSFCGLLVDLKYYYKSEGVIVHHGNFMRYGKYKMFRGGLNPLEIIQYGHIRIFPPLETMKINNVLYAEVFEIGNDKLVTIYSYYSCKQKLYPDVRLYYRMGVKGLERIDFREFVEKVKGPVLLQVDISNHDVHPFIDVEVNKYADHTIVSYSTSKAHSGLRIWGYTGKVYELGKVYDSRRPIMVGLSKLDYFVIRCNAFYVNRGDYNDELIIRSGNRHLGYKKMILMEKSVWVPMVDPAGQLIQSCHREAIYLKNKIDDQPVFYSAITLDIAEQISTELFGIEKVMGRFREWSYTIYNLKRHLEHRNQIKFVVDSRLNNILIEQIDAEAVKCIVEVYSNMEKVYVKITKIVMSGLFFDRDVKIYERNFTENNTFIEMHFNGVERLIEELEKSYPIMIDLYIDNPYTTIIEKGVVPCRSGTAQYYRIRDSCNRGFYGGVKYMINDVWEKDIYEKGNIPVEGYKTRYKMLRNNMNTDRIIVATVETIMVIEGTEFESYSVIRR